MLSINKEYNDDKFYRYKMPELKTVYENSKTKLINIKEISYSIGRDSIIIMNYIKYKLGTHIIGSDSFPGIHKKEYLQDMIFLFINEYVLCKKCGNPETTIVSFKTICKSCGLIYNNDKKDKIIKIYLNKR